MATTAPSSILATALSAGQRVQFSESQRWWRVRAASDDRRFVILTSPFNLRKTVYYTILDTERGVRGPDDRMFSNGYESDSDIADRMRELVAGDIQVNRRPSKWVETRIVSVLPPKTSATADNAPEAT
ncbi:hypothetical protein A5N83_03145 [Rhodococcus sp. 1139]|nr:hypothetical protein A5N83_03145 [Rhodococcus sp. 1139]